MIELINLGLFTVFLALMGAAGMKLDQISQKLSEKS